jgi:hypothetical protein
MVALAALHLLQDDPVQQHGQLGGADLDPGWVVGLVLASGRCLRIPPGFDPAALRALLVVLEGPPC